METCSACGAVLQLNGECDRCTAEKGIMRDATRVDLAQAGRESRCKTQGNPLKRYLFLTDRDTGIEYIWDGGLRVLLMRGGDGVTRPVRFGRAEAYCRSDEWLRARRDAADGGGGTRLRGS